MKGNTYLSPASGETTPFSGSSSLIGALKKEIMELVCYGKYIELKGRIELAAIEATKEERMMCLKILYELAVTTSDDRLRKEILHEIRMIRSMLCCRTGNRQKRTSWCASDGFSKVLF